MRFTVLLSTAFAALALAAPAEGVADVAARQACGNDAYPDCVAGCSRSPASQQQRCREICFEFLCTIFDK